MSIKEKLTAELKNVKLGKYETAVKNAVMKTICNFCEQNAEFKQGKNALYDPDINDSGINSTLVAKGPSAVAYKFIKWIVRRLTPLECERLQGYPDHWTKLPKIEDMTEEEFSFFLQIFLLDKAARGKKTRVPTKASLVKWYNKLDCDGKRYRMCGNSLAIPCALRVLGGIADYNEEKQNGKSYS